MAGLQELRTWPAVFPHELRGDSDTIAMRGRKMRAPTIYALGLAIASTANAAGGTDDFPGSFTGSTPKDNSILHVECSRDAVPVGAKPRITCKNYQTMLMSPPSTEKIEKQIAERSAQFRGAEGAKTFRRDLYRDHSEMLATDGQGSPKLGSSIPPRRRVRHMTCRSSWH